MKRIFSIALVALCLTFSLAPTVKAEPSCASVTGYEVVEVVLPYGTFSVVRETTTTCCYDETNGNMFCAVVTGYIY